MYENKFLCFVYSVFNEHCRLIPQAKLNFHWVLQSLKFSLSTCKTQWIWWAQVDSNHRPRAYQARALTTWAMSPWVSVSSTVDGDDGIRTHDPLLAGQVLSQLSYTPTLFLTHSIYHSMSSKAHSKLNNKSDSVLSNRLPAGWRFSLERRWSSRTFRYGYLVTT